MSRARPLDNKIAQELFAKFAGRPVLDDALKAIAAKFNAQLRLFKAKGS